MSRPIAVIALLLALVVGACAPQGLSKKDVIDGLVERRFTRTQATCIADAIFEQYQGARRQKLAEDLGGDIPEADKATLTAIVDTCVPSTT